METSNLTLSDMDLVLEALPGCKLQEYTKINVPEFEIAGDFIAYASPESTYAVTKKLVDEAESSILIGIYDFTASYMRDILVAAMDSRDVKVSVMLDLDKRKAKAEYNLWGELLQEGITGVTAPSCGNEHKDARYFHSCHEKVIVIDDIWTLVQSGNHTYASIPKNETDGGDPSHFVSGNRDMGVAIKSEALAEFFTQILHSDMKLELEASAVEGIQEDTVPSVEGFLEAARPTKLPPKLFPSKLFKPQKSVKVIPVLSPDNYMKVMPSFLASATKSIYIEQQYILDQSDIRKLLSAIRTAMDKNPGLDVRIVLARPSSDKAKKSIGALEEDFGLALGTNIRFLNPRYFVHCHNKLIIVDRQSVLVSSQNWSNYAVAGNREAGVLLYYPQMARYYAAIFNVDWRTGRKTFGKLAKPDFVPELVAMDAGSAVPVSLGDYVLV